MSIANSVMNAFFFFLDRFRYIKYYKSNWHVELPSFHYVAYSLSTQIEQCGSTNFQLVDREGCWLEREYSTQVVAAMEYCGSCLAILLTLLPVAGKLAAGRVGGVNHEKKRKRRIRDRPKPRSVVVNPHQTLLISLLASADIYHHNPWLRDPFVTQKRKIY